MSAASVPKGPRSIPSGPTYLKKRSSAFVGSRAIPLGDRKLIRSNGHIHPQEFPHAFIPHTRLEDVCDTCGWIEAAHVDSLDSCIAGLIAIHSDLASWHRAA
jgi:hypothetical protein